MQTISKKIGSSNYLIALLLAIIAPNVIADEIVFPSIKGPRVSVNIEQQHVTAKDKDKNINYDIDAAVRRYLKRAENVQLIANESNQRAQLFIVLTQEYSRPGALGQGYCGAGYEDYLLLIEILERRIVLRDQLLLQSCLKSISMLIDQGDDHPSNGFKHEKDGSLSYKLIEDGYDKKRAVTVNALHLKGTSKNLG